MEQLNRYNYLHLLAFILGFLFDSIYRQFHWMRGHGYDASAATSKVTVIISSWIFNPRDMHTNNYSLLTPWTFTSMMVVDANLLFQGVFSIAQMMPSYRSSPLVQKGGIGEWYIVSVVCQVLNVLGSMNVFDATFSTLLAGCHLFCLLRILKNQHEIVWSSPMPLPPSSSPSSGRRKNAHDNTCDVNNCTVTAIDLWAHDRVKNRESRVDNERVITAMEEYWLLRFPFALSASWAGFLFLWSTNMWFLTFWTSVVSSMNALLVVVQIVLFLVSLGLMTGASAKLLYYNGGSSFYPAAYVFSWIVFGITGNLQNTFHSAGFNNGSLSSWLIIPLQVVSAIICLILFGGALHAYRKNCIRLNGGGCENYDYPTSTSTDESDASYEGGKMTMDGDGGDEEMTVYTRTEI